MGFFHCTILFIYLLVGMFHCTSEVHGRKQEEYKGLHNAYEDTQGHYRQRGKEHPCQHKQDPHDQFVTCDVSKKTDAERKYAGQVTDHFNREYNG